MSAAGGRLGRVLRRDRSALDGRLRQRAAGAGRRAADSELGRRFTERRRARLIASSSYFDPAWYLEVHDDLVDVDPLTHYLLHGESEGRNPGPDFDTPAYVWCNPGARGAALTHFVTHAAPGQPPEHVVDLSQPVLAERWFDPDWYERRHPDLDLTGLDIGSRTAVAWQHYRLHGGAPSPYFDREDFEIRNGVDATPEPLTAWDARRDTDVRPGRVVAANGGDRRGPLARPSLLPRRDLAEVRVAAAIHVFHLDLLGELLERLRSIPGRLTVLVTTADVDAIGQIDAHISAVLGPVPRTVRFTPNAGRNFGPLLAGLDHDLREHDVVLHLHTKKSLASGSEQRDWREHLLDGLLPSPAGVAAIVGALAAADAPPSEFSDRDPGSGAAAVDRPIGVIHGPTWPGLPRFANHWLGNRGNGELLFAALGLDPADASGWLDYPVGGMFWARTDALGPLLDLTIQFAEFGEELGQTDRTLAHAIERVIPASARAAGFDVVELDHESAQWRRNWSERNATAMGAFDAPALAELERQLAVADVVSVDLFDTLLLRPTTDPDGLFDLLVDALDADDGLVGDASSIVAARRRAEHRLRVAPNAEGDVTLDEIVAEMVAALGVVRADADLLRRAELDLEHRLALPRRWLIERLGRVRAERPDVRLVLMTDTTQPPDAIDALLERIGAGEVFHERYVSNDRRARKDSGALWQVVQHAESPNHLLQIGDNPMSDLQQASDRGHHWFQTAAPGELPAIGGVELRRIGPTGPMTRRRATEFLVGHGLAELAARTTPPQHDRGQSLPVPENDRGQSSAVLGADDPRVVFGFGVVGPMMTAFANWCLETAGRHDLDTLVFGGRDGHLVHAVAERLAALDPSAPAVVYFPVSRRMVLGAGLEHEHGLPALLDAGPWTGSISDLLSVRAGVRLDGDADLSTKQVTLPDDRERVLRTLEPFADELAAYGTTEAAALRSAFDAATPSAGRVALVDLGYSGTILRNLRGLIERPITGLFGVSTAAVDDLDDTRTCFTVDARIGHGDLVYDRAKTWELLCSRVDEQAAHYCADHDAGGAISLRTTAGTAPPAEVAAVVASVQSAALDFVDAHLARFGPDWLRAPVDAPAVRRAFQASLGHGVPDPDDVFGDLTIDDDFRNLGRIGVRDR
ncbi:MAG: rhamnan synthesis F family protein [Actinomycetota bacterium]